MTEFEIKVCNKIKTLIDKSEFNAKEISQKLNIDNGTISRWKNKKNAPTLKNIANLALILDVDPIVFFTDDEAIDTSEILSKLKQLEKRIDEQQEKQNDFFNKTINSN